MTPQEKQYLELEKFKFLQAYDQEAKRINKLLEKYPDNEHYKQTSANLELMLSGFEFFDKYILSLHTHHTLLKVENHLLQQDYARDFNNEIDKALGLNGPNKQANV